ncbi:HU family DNA-binding protein, partial [Gemmiger formicilis]|nr:HU family DNA-binding protein [Gemmiger formicilis]
IGDVLKGGDKVTIAGFGRFEMRERQTKNFTNPKTKVTNKPENFVLFKADGDQDRPNLT